MKKLFAVVLCIFALLCNGTFACADTESDYTVVDMTTGEDVVSCAMEYLNAPYKWGGESPEEGFDCSGLVNYVFNEFGIYVSRTVKGISKNGTDVGIDEVKPGDVIIFKCDGDYTHCGLYVGDNQIIHSFNESQGVVITDINGCVYDEIIVRRII